MYLIELAVFALSIYYTAKLLTGWYRTLSKAWPPQRHRGTGIILGSLPVFAFAIILYTLKVLASFDVVGDFFYLLMYIVLGFAWIYWGLRAMSACFDLSWNDDAVYAGNRAALFPVVAGFLALTLIYAAANTGDGPGWWCVIFAGLLGLAAWILLGVLINLCARVSERITVDRDTGCGLRFGGYLLASGIILGRACAGDWTSFWQTIVEFGAGWPVIPLTALYLLIEVAFLQRSKSAPVKRAGIPVFSIFLGLIFIAAAAATVLYLIPAPAENPVYYGAPSGLL